MDTPPLKKQYQHLQSGDGTDNRQIVNEHGEAKVTSVNRTEMANIAERDGLSFLFTTINPIEIKSEGEHAVIYLRNNNIFDDRFISDDDFLNLKIAAIKVYGDQKQHWKMYRNAEDGPIVTDMEPALKTNLNLGSDQSAAARVYSGPKLHDKEQGVLMDQWVNEAHHTEKYKGALILGVEDSITLTLQMAPGIATVRIYGYFDKDLSEVF